jgi:prevent-host-death family protein
MIQDMAKATKPAQTQTFGVSEFKARCLELLEAVSARGDELIITKRGKPIAKIEPIRPAVDDLKGAYAGRMKIIGDIVNFNLADDWDANR